MIDRERLAEALCDQFDGMIHNQSTTWDRESEGTRDWWRDQADGINQRLGAVSGSDSPGKTAFLAAAAEANARGLHILTEDEARRLNGTWVDRRYPACIEAWPECIDGEYNPRCCRFPKSCSCET